MFYVWEEVGQDTFMVADYEDWEESEVSEIHVKRFKNQEVFVTKGYEFSCANGTLRLLNRPRPSSTVEENLLQEDHVETEEGHKKGSKTGDSLSTTKEMCLSTP